MTRHTRTAFSLLVVLLVSSLTSCGAKDAPRADGGKQNGPLPNVGDAGQVMLQTATFTFATADGEGNQLVRGQFTLPWPIAEGQTVRGSWESRYVGPRSATQPGEELNAVGPQVGRGTLTAERSGGEVTINLNPRMNDNNVTLHGTVEGDALRGRWDYATFAGVSATGIFEAQRQP